MASTVFCNTASTASRSSGVRHGAGAYAPMPPVFGPLSPSSARLWSWAGAIMAARLPSANAMQLTSSPSSSSSMTTSSPAAPKAPSSMQLLTAPKASSRHSGMSTPLPAASPLAFTTTWRPAAYSALMYSQAASCSSFVKVLKAAVGRPCSAKKRFENAFDASSSAARLVGPKQRMPASLQASARPATSGASGPTKTRATFFSDAKATSFAISLSPIATFVIAGSAAVPPLPGAQ
mmetsp:Transcript_57526/g.160160  ORF Transcript_57526/g.160160 Transcript_57526/m.160160 type:complete len:235 (-) Transcript_57526:193-897(-)